MTTPPTHAPVDPSNAAQRDAWDGEAGAFWADQADRFDRTIAAYDDDLHAAAAIEPADRVLDVGCGTGHTARRAARAAPTGSVLGVDLSAAMLDVARRRAAEEGIANVEFLQADAQVHPFDRGAFDVVVSRTGAMFFAPARRRLHQHRWCAPPRRAPRAAGLAGGRAQRVDPRS